MANYNLSARSRIADLVAGMRVETGTLAAATYLDHTTASGVQPLYTVVGRIMLLQLYLEVTSVLNADAAVVKFQAAFTTPVHAASDLSGASASVSGLAAGRRIVWIGGVVATATVITADEGISDVICVNPQIIGGHGFIGTIGMHTGTATVASGAVKGSLNYVPLSDGAYVQSLT
jgi:hypothetical protein